MRSVSVTFLCALFFTSAVVAQQVISPAPAPQTVDQITQDILRDAKLGKDKPAATERRARALKDTIESRFTPDEIRMYREALIASERARSGVYTREVVGTVRTIEVNSSRAGVIPSLRISAASTTTLVFTDALGNPWKIVDDALPLSLANAKRVGHMLLLSPPDTNEGSSFGNGTMSVILEGPKVIAFGVSSGMSPQVDSVVHIRVDGKNPSVPVISIGGGATQENDPDFLGFVDGVAPDAAKSLRTSNNTVEAWSFKGILYVRTRLSLHSPEFQLRATAPSGHVVYRFGDMPSIINAIDDGRVVAIAIGD